MSKFNCLVGSSLRTAGFVCALASMGFTASAGATTIVLDQFQRNDGGSSFWTGTETFSLPSDATGVSINITGFAADDRAVLELNDVAIDSTGIFGYGTGPSSFQFSTTGPNLPATFITSGRPEQAFVPQDLTITSGFVTGLNTLTFIVNDTGEGVNGGLSTPNAGLTAYNFAGTLSFSSAVPEPSTWMMMLLGFGMIGFAMRNRNKHAVSITYA